MLPRLGAASAMLATSLGLHRALGSWDRVRLFLAVSAFVRSKHVQAGLSPERIRVKPNFAQPVARRQGSGEYLLAMGRLTPEKGFDTVIAAAREDGHRLLVVGDGPRERRFRRWPARMRRSWAPSNANAFWSCWAALAPSSSRRDATRDHRERYSKRSQQESGRSQVESEESPSCSAIPPREFFFLPTTTRLG